MDHKTYRSKPIVVAVLLLFVAVLSGESFAQFDGQAQNEFTKAFQAGKKLYEDGEHKEAALKFFQALTSAKEKSEIVEAWFYLSLSYYGLGDSDNTQLYMKKMFEAQPEREIDARLFPAGYVILFYRMKSDLAKSQPVKIEDKPKAKEKKAELEKKAKEEEKKPVAVAGKAEAAPPVKKKGKFPWLIVGGLVIVTGIVLYLLLNKKKGSDQGSISVTSTPAGANLFLDGSATGLTTACTLNNVSAGSHTVKLVKDGYADYQQNVTVVGGQTATVNAVMTRNSIVITSPASGTMWTKESSNDIRWHVDSTALSQEPAAKFGSSKRDDLGNSPGRSDVVEKPNGGLKRGDRSGSAVGGSDSLPGRPAPFVVSGFSPFPASRLQKGGLLDISKVKIELYKGGGLISVIVAETDNNGTYPWQIPAATANGSDYKVRISCSTDSSIYGESWSFTISAGSITVNEPLSGSVWGKGSTYGIKWMSTAVGNIKIELFKGTSFVLTIAGDTPNDGIQNWTIPTVLADGSDYKIRISSVSKPNVFGDSGFFQIGVSSYEFVIKWGSLGSGDGQFNTPEGVTIDGSGYVYVADNQNHRIQKFTGSGAFVAKWGSYGTGDGQIGCPYGITADNAGFIYVSEFCNTRIQKFTSTGIFVARWAGPGMSSGQLREPKGIAVDSHGNIYVADSANDRMQKFNSSGVFVTKWGMRGTGDSWFISPSGITIDGSDTIFITDTGNSLIQKFNTSGTFLAKWGSQGSGDGQLVSPHGIAVDRSGFIYIADMSKNQIQKFNSIGTFITKWGSFGTGDGQFDYPKGIAVDGSGNVYVVDQRNSRIQKFSPRPDASLLSSYRQISGPSAIQGNRGRN